MALAIECPATRHWPRHACSRASGSFALADRALRSRVSAGAAAQFAGSNLTLVRQSRLQQALAHMLSVGGIAIVQGADEGLSREGRLPLHDLAGVGA